LPSLTGDEIAPPARDTVSAMASMPADANPGAQFPFGNFRANGIQEPNDFVPGNTRKLEVIG
jgi:hypothetical protein